MMLTAQQLAIMNGPFPPHEVCAYQPRVPKASARERVEAQCKREREALAAFWQTENPAHVNLSQGMSRYTISGNEFRRYFTAEPTPLFPEPQPSWPEPAAAFAARPSIRPSLDDRNAQRRDARVRDAAATRQALDNLLGGRTRS